MRALNIEIMEIVDAFLTEAKGLNGEERSLSNLNKDRKLACKALENLVDRHISNVEKAFGGCTNCYGKGYATTLLYARGKGERDMGEAGIEINKELPRVQPCTCERGEDIEKIINYKE